MSPLRIRTRTKYAAEPTTVDGIRFHSRKEARRYQELKLLEKAGEIYNLRLQRKYELSIGASTLGFYLADFCYDIRRPQRDKNGKVLIDLGETIVEDVKGVDTPLSKWKRKHVEAQYGITVRLT